MFDKGLSKEIKQALCNFQCPAKFQDYFFTVVDLDNCHIEFCQEFNAEGSWIHPSPVLHHSVPATQGGTADMVIGATQHCRPLPPNKCQCQCLMDNNLCLYCGEEEHIIGTCPKIKRCQMQPPHRNLVGATKLDGIGHLYLHMELLLSSKPASSTNVLVDFDADESLVNQHFIHLCKITP